METKTYYAEDMPAAMEQIKRELGSDAIIIKSRKIKRKYGPLGLLSKSMYEVVVSCDEQTPSLPRRTPAWAPSYSNRPAPAQQTSAAQAQRPNPPSFVQTPAIEPEHFSHINYAAQTAYPQEQDAQDAYWLRSAAQAPEQPAPLTAASKLGAYTAQAGQASEPKAAPAEFQPAPHPAFLHAYPPVGANPAPAPAPVKQRELPQKPALPSEAQSAQPSVREAPLNAPSWEESEALERLEALERMIKQIHQRLPEQPQPRQTISAAKQLESILRSGSGVTRQANLDMLLERLAQQDVDQPALQELAELARRRQQEGVSDYEALCDALRHILGKPRYLRASMRKPRVILFIGPTGVGKTTTLVKLVSSCTFERDAKVGIINADVFRVGAQDQLGAYARVMDVPITTIYDPDELVDAIAAFSDLDFIFIDTSGRAPQDEAYQAELSRLITQGEVQEIYLTFSSATSGRVCRHIAREYRNIGAYRLIVTKLDEGGSYGAAVNMCHASGQPLSYITTGQNVPEDIQKANVEEIIECLLR